MKAFIYEWTDVRTNLKYIGRHVGEFDDGYIGSGTIFRKEYDKRPEDFFRKILWEDIYTTDDIIKDKEDEILKLISNDELYHGPNRKYYNQVKNSWGYSSNNNPMRNPEVVQRMLETREKKGIEANPWKNTLNKYGSDELFRMKSERAMNNRYGNGNKGKTKSEDHKNKISESICKMYKDRKRSPNSQHAKIGRKREIDYSLLVNTVKEFGFNEASLRLQLSLDLLKSRYYNALKALAKEQIAPVA